MTNSLIIENFSNVYMSDIECKNTTTLLGCLKIWKVNKFMLRRSLLKSNKGGGMNIQYAQTVSITNNSFVRNSGKHGGLSVIHCQTVTIINCFFERNTAKLGPKSWSQEYYVGTEKFSERGGAVNIQSSKTEVINSKFTRNNAYNEGGSIFAVCNGNMTVKITKSSFRGGFAGVGGTIFIVNCNMLLNSTIIRKNVGRYAVGGIHLLSPLTKKVTATICNSLLVNNSAAALHLRVSTIMLKNVTLLVTTDTFSNHIISEGNELVLESIQKSHQKSTLIKT